jgi:hypothetical protein
MHITLLTWCWTTFYDQHSRSPSWSRLIQLRHTAYNYLLQLTLWHSRQVSITVYIATSLFHNHSLTLYLTLSSSLRAPNPLHLLYHTSPLIPASNGGRFPSWVPEMSPSQSHSDTQCALHLYMPPLVQICNVWSSPNNRLPELCPITGRSRSYFTTDSQSVCLTIEYPSGICNQILFPVGMLLSEICGLVSVGCPLWRQDGSAVCSVITQWSESLRTRYHTLLSHLRLPQPGGPVLSLLGALSDERSGLSLVSHCQQ